MNTKTRQLINNISVFIYAMIAIGFAIFLLSIGAYQLEKGEISDGICLIMASLYIVIVLHGILIIHGVRYILSKNKCNNE